MNSIGENSEANKPLCHLLPLVEQSEWVRTENGVTAGIVQQVAITVNVHGALPMLLLMDLLATTTIHEAMTNGLSIIGALVLHHLNSETRLQPGLGIKVTHCPQDHLRAIQDGRIGVEKAQMTGDLDLDLLEEDLRSMEDLLWTLTFPATAMEPILPEQGLIEGTEAGMEIETLMIRTGGGAEVLYTTCPRTACGKGSGKSTDAEHVWRPIPFHASHPIFLVVEDSFAVCSLGLTVIGERNKVLACLTGGSV